MDKKHKIGRNDPCPCGSGKKYKRCCGAILHTSVEGNEEIDYFNLNREIAYKGKIGRMRKNFCIRYIEHKQAAFKEIKQVLIEQTAARGETITCHKGCFFCCAQHVSASLQENEAIVYHLYQNETVLTDFLQAYPRWRAEVGKNEPLFKRISQLYNESVACGFPEEKQRAFMEEADHYLAQNIPCPFLTNGLCSIYEVRPWACASLVATTPAEWCSPLNPNKPKVYMTYSGMTREIREMPFYRKTEFYILSTMPLAVYEILKAGFSWLSAVPGLEGLEDEIINDPEVRVILQRYFNTH